MLACSVGRDRLQHRGNAGSWDGTLCVLRAPDGAAASDGDSGPAELEVLAIQAYDSGIAAVCMLSDGKTAVVALKSSCRLRLYDTEQLQACTQLQPPVSPCRLCLRPPARNLLCPLAGAPCSWADALAISISMLP